MSQKYKQPSYSIAQQIERIKSKYNIKIDIPVSEAERYLININYYRLNTYFFKLRGEPFTKVMKYYNLDRKLRLLILEAIEMIETSIKALLVGILCEKYYSNPFWYKDRTKFNSVKSFIAFINLIKEVKHEYGDENEIKDYIHQYSEDLPIWVLIEKCSFGDVAKIYSYLNIEDSKLIAQHFGETAEGFKNHLHWLTYIRNLCAHYVHLFDRTMKIKIHGNHDLYIPEDKTETPAGYVILLHHYIKLVLSNSMWKNKVIDLLSKYQDNHGVSLSHWGIDTPDFLVN